MTEEYDLTKSSKALGKLYPILKDPHGNIIDGFHRQNADPDWHAIQVDTVDTPVKLELARLAVNFCRRTLPATEIEQRITFLIKNGMKVEDISEQTGISVPTIYRHMPQELKDETKVEAGKIGGEVSAIKREQNSKTSDMVDCDNCHMATHISKMKTLREQDLCPLCFEHLSKMPKTPEKPVTVYDSEKPKETWEQRKAQMSPGVSKMDVAVYSVLQNHRDLRDAGWKFEFQKHYCIKEVVADVTASKGLVEEPLFFDGEVHVGKQDRDENLREMLTKRYQIRTLSIPYKAFTKEETNRVFNLISEEMKA